MKVILRVEKGIAPNQNFAISRNTLVGRSNSCDLRIESDDVSRRHCFLLVTDNGVWVRDLSSSNGTSVDGNVIEKGQDCMLFPGSHVEIGPVEFSVHFQLAKEPATAQVGSYYSANNRQLTNEDAIVLLSDTSNICTTNHLDETAEIPVTTNRELNCAETDSRHRHSHSSLRIDQADFDASGNDSGRLKSLFSQLVGWTKTRP